MELKLTPEQEAQLMEVARLEGKTADQLAQELFSDALTEEAHFATQVDAGREAARRGGFVDTHEVWARVERLQSQ